MKSSVTRVISYPLARKPKTILVYLGITKPTSTTSCRVDPKDCLDSVKTLFCPLVGLCFQRYFTVLKLMISEFASVICAFGSHSACRGPLEQTKWVSVLFSVSRRFSTSIIRNFWHSPITCAFRSNQQFTSLSSISCTRLCLSSNLIDLSVTNNTQDIVYMGLGGWTSG